MQVSHAEQKTHTEPNPAPIDSTYLREALAAALTLAGQPVYVGGRPSNLGPWKPTKKPR